MKTAAKCRGPKLAGIIILPALLIVFISFLGFSETLAGTPKGGPEDKPGIEHLLPPDTLFCFCTEDMSLAKKYAKDMPLHKILAEPEVIDFLEKPKQFIHGAWEQLKKQASEDEAFSKIDFDLSKFSDADVGQCFFAMTHLTFPNADSPPPMGLIPDIGLVVGAEFRNPDQNIIQFLKETMLSIAKAKDCPVEIAKEEYNGVPYERVVLPLPLPVLSPCIFKIGNVEVVTTSETSMKAMLDLHSGLSEDSLAKRGDFAASMRYIDFSDLGASKAYLNVDDLVSLIESVVVMALDAKRTSLEEYSSGEEDTIELLRGLPEKLRKLVDLSGLKSLNAIYGSNISKNGLATSTSYLTMNGPAKGLPALVPDVPVTEEKLRMIPQEATAFSIGQFDLAGLYDLVMEGIQTFDPEVHAEVQGAIQGFCQQLADSEEGDVIDLRRDIFGALGTEFISYKLKPRGMAMMGMAQPVFFFVDAKDYPRFVGATNGLFSGLKKIAPEVGGFVSMKSVDFEGEKIYYLQFQQMPIPFQPSFTKIDKYVVFSFDIKELKRLVKEFGKSETSILDNEDFLLHYKRLPKGKELLGIKYTNVPVEFASIYEQITPMLPMLTMSLPPDFELPIDFMLLPTSESITKHLFPSLAVHFEDGEGYKWLSYGPFGPEAAQILVATIVGGAAAALLLVGEAEEDWAVIESDKPYALEADYTEEKVDPAILAKKDMGILAGSCTAYHIEHGQYPDGLEDLLVPTDGFPDGFYPPKKLPVDPWGNPYHYKKFLVGEHKYMIWSSGSNGIDEGGKGDDIAKLK